MDTVERYHEKIEEILTEHTKVPYAYGEIQTETVFDRGSGRFLLVNVGWDEGRRVHGSLVHVDVIGDKLWIQRDGTEVGIATELVAVGVPKKNIVLAFRSAELRRHTDFAIS